MGKSVSLNNVTKSRFSCMKSTMRSRINAFAQKNGYRVTVYSVPDGGRWHVRLESSKSGKPSLDFIAKVSRNNNILNIELLNKPSFISTSAAIREVNSVYNSCRP